MFVKVPVGGLALVFLLAGLVRRLGLSEQVNKKIKCKMLLNSKLIKIPSYRASRQRLKRVSRSGNNSETGSLSSETEIFQPFTLCSVI